MNERIYRDLQETASQEYDAIIVGGGVYGSCIALESSRRGLKTLLLEAEDFGGRTSFNHLRVIHGGLRYLQKLDLKRYFISVGERAWFLRYFSEMVQPLNCLMPLYGNGLKRPDVFRLALLLNDFLSAQNNRSIPKNNRLISGRILSQKESLNVFPDVDLQGLKGSALWQDAFALDSPRMVFELLRWAMREGANAKNYVRVQALETSNNQVIGVTAVDEISKQGFVFRSNIVINATGPDCRAFAREAHRDFPELFPNRILVWNLLMKRPPISSCAVAVTPRNNNTHTYFIPPWHGQLMIGTGHSVLGPAENRHPSAQELDKFLSDINQAIPGINLHREEIRRVSWGIMPGKINGTLGTREVFIDHQNTGGPIGFYSISGVKFTTARYVADKALDGIFPLKKPIPYGSRFCRPEISNIWRINNSGLNGDFSMKVHRILNEESVARLGDLIFRRTDLGDSADLNYTAINNCAELMGFKGDELCVEVADVVKKYASNLNVRS